MGRTATAGGLHLRAAGSRPLHHRGFGRERVRIGARACARAHRGGGSPLVIEDGTEAPPLAFGEYVPTARPGSRAPHLWLDDETSLYDRFGWGFTLLKLDDDALDAPLRLAAEQRRVPLTVVDLGLVEARELYESSLVLIRPDQHVAWRGERLPDDCDRLLQTVCGALASRASSARSAADRGDTDRSGYSEPIQPVSHTGR
jgi:hypothetical protein